jgi:phage/plasmid-associated DNA primase
MLEGGVNSVASRFAMVVPGSGGTGMAATGKHWNRAQQRSTWKLLQRCTRPRLIFTPQEAWTAGSRIAVAECTMIFTEGQGKINFENGTLDLSTMTLFPFRREDYLTYCLSYYYAPGTHPTIDRFLKETIPDVHARLL